MLTKDFLKPVMWEILIAIPFSWIVMKAWLQNYASHISLSLDLFVFGEIGSILISLLTISSLVLKAAVINPVKNLRTQ